MTSAQTISLRLDTQAAERALARLLAELESRSDLVQAFLKPLDSLPELFSIDLEQLPAGRAIHLRAVLQPTDFLRELVLAIGAGDVDLLLVESCAHGGAHVE